MDNKRYRLIYWDCIRHKSTLIFSGDTMSEMRAGAKMDIYKNDRLPSGYTVEVIETHTLFTSQEDEQILASLLLYKRQRARQGN